jgi:hypothetical protein
MMTYTEAPTVSSGSGITSAQYNTLATAFNQRLTYGPGDVPWRLWFKVWGLARQIVDDVGSPNDEWLHSYLNVGEEHELAFEPNINNPLIRFVQGGYDAESELRYNDVPVAEFTSSAALWELAKLQRGAIDFDLEIEASPSLAAARSFRPVVEFDRMHHWSTVTETLETPLWQYGYGGHMPFPPATAICSGEPVYDPDTFEWNPGVGYYGYNITFKNLSGGADVTYSTCKYNQGSMVPNGNGVYRVSRLENGYLVHFYGSGSQYLPYKDYQYGPHYGTTVLQHTDQEVIEPVMQKYASDFGRGTDAERADENYKVKNVGFNFQRFFNNQYYLAPALAEDLAGREVTTYVSEEGSFSIGSPLYNQNEEEYWYPPVGGISYTIEKVVIDALVGPGLPHRFGIYVNDSTTLVATVQMTYDEEGELIPNVYYPGVVVTENVSVRCLDEYTSTNRVQIAITLKPILSEVTSVYPNFTNTNAEMVPGDFLIDSNEETYKDVPTPNMWAVIGVRVDVGSIESSLGAYNQSSVRLSFMDQDLSQVTPIQKAISTNGSYVYMFPNATSWNQLRVKTDSYIHPNTTITVEYAVVMKMKPRIEDAYVMLRLGTTDSDGLSLDGIGKNDSAKEIEKNYFNAGALCGTGETIPIQTSLSSNPWYQTARKMIHDRLRLVKRNHPDTSQAIKGYAVESGKTVLWFDRYFTISGETFDMFDGIAPPTESITTIQDGYVYKVSGSAVTYSGSTYNHGDTFVGVDGIEAFSGSGIVKQHEGIVDRAPRRGFTNEWIMFLTFCGTKLSGPFAPEEWDKVGFLQNRCHFLSAGMQFSDLCGHAAYSQCPSSGAPLVTAPSMHNYYDFLNDISGYSNAVKDRFYKSCQLYQAPYQIESATYDETTGEVRLQFTGRFQTATGSADINRASGAASCNTELYRTDENGVREYLYSQEPSGSQCTLLAGDVAELYGSDTYGSCHPRFYFTKLHPYVRVDLPSDNNTAEPQYDTRCIADEMQWMTFALSAMCEGFIDVEGAQAAPTSACPDRPPHYRFENLMRQTNGSITMGFMPETANDLYVRQDRPNGFGPFANSKMYADQFNRLALAVNKLEYVPMEVPWPYEKKFVQYDQFEPWPFTLAACSEDDPGGTDCTTGSFATPGAACASSGSFFEPEGAAYATIYGPYDPPAPAGTLTNSSSWTPGFSVDAGSSCGIGTVVCDAIGAGQHKVRLMCGDDGFTFVRHTTYWWYETRIAATASAWNVVPDALRQNVEMHTNMLGIITHQESYLTAHLTGSPPPGAFQVECGGEFGFQWNDSCTPLYYTTNTTTVASCRFFELSDSDQVINMRRELFGSGSDGAGEHLCPGGHDAWAATSAPIHAGGSNISCGAGGSYKSLDFTPITEAFVAVRIPVTSSL